MRREQVVVVLVTVAVVFFLLGRLSVAPTGSGQVATQSTPAQTGAP